MQQRNLYRVRVRPEGSRGAMTVLRRAHHSRDARAAAQAEGYEVLAVRKQRA